MYARVNRILQDAIRTMEGFYPVKHWMVGYNLMLWDVKKSRCGGGRGIRTPEDLAALTNIESQWLE